MNFHNIYIPKDIIEDIYINLQKEDYLCFTHINKYIYNNFKIKNKYKIFEFINKDYKLFKKYINIYTYNQQELNNIGLICSLNTIEINTTLYNYYDLRYIFESLINKSKIDTNLISSRILIYIISTIKKCIGFDRYHTIFNINNDMLLYPLHNNFIPDKEDNWIYI